MNRFDGAVARKLAADPSNPRLDFGAMTTTFGAARLGRAELRLAGRQCVGGPDKYKVLEHRRRQAQIRARRLLGL
jgi:hypothetical protein